MQSQRLWAVCVSLLIFFSVHVFYQTGFPVGELNYITAPDLSRPIDQNKPVFTIPASVNVSNGNLNYSIPINIPDGVNGMQPNLSIGYNSAGGNGLLGYGWSLGGLSSITRVGDNFIFDGNRYGAELDNSDNLAIDGQRLVLESGSNLIAGSVYKTGIETFQKVIKLGQGNGFVVQQKDGVKKYYGQTTASQIIVSNGTGSTPIVWLLDMMEDRNGNKIRYDYVKNATTNEYRLDKIRYILNSASVINHRFQAA